MKKQILISIIVLLCMSMIAFAEPDYVFKDDQNIDLKVSCFNSTQQVCRPTTHCNITVSYPNSSVLIQNQAMSYAVSYFNYTIPQAQINRVIGEFPSTAYCCDSYECGYQTFTFLINAEGSRTSTYVMIIIFLIFTYGLLVWGFKMDDANIVTMASLFLIVAGIYIHLRGIADLNNYLTSAFALVNIAIGIYILIRTQIERSEWAMGESGE